LLLAMPDLPQASFDIGLPVGAGNDGAGAPTFAKRDGAGRRN